MMSMKKRKIKLSDLIFILFYKKNGKIVGSTKIQKLIDIIRLDSEFEVDAKYDPYNFGDFSIEIVDLVNVYIDNDWLVKKNEVYQNKQVDIFKLTPTGMKIAKTLYDDLIHKDRRSFEILDDFEDKNTPQIMSFSYFWYPETAINSIIKNEIFQKKPILESFSGLLIEEYDQIIKSGVGIKESLRENWRY